MQMTQDCKWGSLTFERCVDVRLVEVAGEAVDANALSDGVKGVAQPLALCLLTRVHHASGHLQARASGQWVYTESGLSVATRG